MSDLVQQSISLLKNFPYKLTQDGDSTKIEIYNSSCTRTVKIEERRRLIVMYSSHPDIKARNQDARNHSFMFMVKANEHIKFGNIEMIPDTSEFRFKTSQTFPGVENVTEVLGYMLEFHDQVFPEIFNAVNALNNTRTDPITIANNFRRFKN